MVVSWSFNSTTNTATASGAGSTNFAALVAADTAGGWGKFTADATGVQILCQAKIVIGDGSNTISFYDTNKQVTFTSTVVSANYEVLIKLNKCNFTLGTLNDATLKTTYQGCSIISLDTKTTELIDTTTNPSLNYVNLYSTTISKTAGSAYMGGGVTSNWKIYNSILINTEVWQVQGTTRLDLYNSQIQKSGLYSLDQAYGSVEKTTFTDCTKVFYQLGTGTFKNCVTKNTGTYTFDVRANYYYYHVNPDYDKWVINWVTDGKIFRQYEFDAVVTDSAYNPLENASVTLTKGSTTLELTTDANGAITTQTLTYGYYDQAHGNTIQDSGNWTLTITKTGYQTYTASCPITEKTKLHIALIEETVLTGTATPADVLTGKTFYKDNANVKLTGKLNFPVVSAPPRTRTKRVVNPMDEPLALTTAVLLAKELRRSRMAKFKVTS